MHKTDETRFFFYKNAEERLERIQIYSNCMILVVMNCTNVFKGLMTKTKVITLHSAENQIYMWQVRKKSPD